jgi:hypothetical protein
MKKQIQLFTYIFDFGLKGTTHEIEPFYRAIKKAAEKLCDNTVQGQVRVTCESSDNQATKRWEMKIICPPLPKNHPLHYKLTGLIETASHDKRVYSWGCMDKETVF